MANEQFREFVGCCVMIFMTVWVSLVYISCSLETFSMIPCHDFLMVRLETEGTFPYGDGLCSMISALLSRVVPGQK